MSKSVDLILSAVKSAGEAALRLHEESESLRSRLAEANALMQLARDYVEANQGGWCRDGVGSSIVLKHIDAHLSRKEGET